MALCVEIQSGTGFLIQSSQPIDSCTDYALLHISEYASQATLQNIFTVPIVGDLQEMWMLGFSLPVIAYLTAWAYGVVINWFNREPGY